MALIAFKNLITQFRSIIRACKNKRPREVEAGIGDSEVRPVNDHRLIALNNKNVSWMKILVDG